jgi:hypothetical protein
MRRLLSSAIVALAVLAPGGVTAKADVCSLGRAVDERVLIRPRPGSFYSVDALNPDVVRYRGRWLMYFSGNRLHGADSAWRTGLATAPALGGPWRVRPGWSIPYLNGGSAVWRGRLWQAAQSWSDRFFWLLSSRDGLRWRRVRQLPGPLGRYSDVTVDHSLQVVPDGLRMWVAARPPTVGAGSDLAYYDLRYGNVGAPHRVLSGERFAWSVYDLGEPWIVRLPQGLGMFYNGTAAMPFARSIGMAVRQPAGWRVCPVPVIAAGSPFWAVGGTVADASVVRQGRRTYVFFAAGPGLSTVSDLAAAVGVRVYQRRAD